MILMSLDYLLFVIICLDPFGFAYSDSEAWDEVVPSTEDRAYLSEQADQL